MRAVWNGAVLAESGDTVVVEGNHYFPAESLDRKYFVESGKHTTCPWKGKASYSTIVVDGQENKDAAWYYPQPSPAAEQIQGRVAFWRGVELVDDQADPADESPATGLFSRLVRSAKRAA